MKIKINGKEENLEVNALTISDLLKKQGVKTPEMVTVQLNGRFVSRDELTTTQVEANDEIDFLYFMGGGQPHLHSQRSIRPGHAKKRNPKFSPTLLAERCFCYNFL
ncbi:MAG: sulfur carrier protein ThiS [Marinilabilia sp.]